MFWPENLRHYTSVKVQQLEQYLNTFLSHFQTIYYCGGTASGFVAEKGPESLLFNICALKEHAEEKGGFSCRYSYKHVCQITLTMSDLQRDSGFAFESRSTLIYDLAYGQSARNEAASCSGQFLHSAQKNYLKSQKNLSNEEVIEIVGSFFEKADCALRACFKGQLFKILGNKLEALGENLEVVRPEISKINSSLRETKHKFIPDTSVKVIPLK